MGTRHMIAVIDKSGERKVAQYGQWDGYPSGQGADILAFLGNPEFHLDIFSDALQHCRFISDSEVEAHWKEVGADDSGFVGMDVAEKFKKRWPQLSRDYGAKVLGHVYTSDAEDPLELVDQYDFAADGLFCEWAYVIDLQKGTFEVYEGFKKDDAPEDQRFAEFNGAKRGNAEYGPVHLRATWPLSNLPSRDGFLIMFKDPEESEEAA